MYDDTKQKIEELTKNFLPEKGEPVEETIKRLQAVKKLEKDDAVKVLNNLAGRERHPKILAHVIKELGKYKDKSSTHILIEVLLGYKDCKNEYDDARTAAVNILGNLKDETAIVPLMNIMNDRDEGYRLRLWAADALGKIGSSQAVLPLMNIVSDEDEKSVYLKESAAKALGMIGDDRAIDSLIGVLETKQGMLDRFAYLKEKAIEALGKLTQKKDCRVKALKNVLHDESSQVRASAVDALAEIDDDAITAIIEPMVFDHDEKVGRTAVCALYSREGRAYILNLMEKENLPSACKEEIMDLLEEEEDEEDDE